MKKRKLLILDEEPEYACRFSAWFERRGCYPFTSMAFTKKEALYHYASTGKADILLAAEKSMCQEITEIPVGLLAVLREDGENAFAAGFPSVKKYQSCRNIMQEVLELYGDRTQKEGEYAGSGRNMCLLGVYSPVSRSGKTTFALALGQILSERQPVLYINLETWPGFEELFSHTYERSLSDIFYGIRQKKGNFAIQAAGMVQEVGNFHYLPPFLVPGDEENVNDEEWETFMEGLGKNSIYETVILDFGNTLHKLTSLAELCSQIYMPVLEDAISRAKIHQMEMYLKNAGLETVSEKIKKISLPKPPDFEEGWPECLKYGEFGSYVRRILQNGGVPRAERHSDGQAGSYVGMYR